MHRTVGLGNLRLELGHHLEPEPLRTTEFAPALGTPQAGQAPAQGYEPPAIGGTWKAGCYARKDFGLSPDGTMCCPTGKKLFPQERRLERSGSLRIVYEARIADCRLCEQRPHCQWHGQENQHPRRVSVLLHPRKSGSDPLLLWEGWPRRTQRRACRKVLHRQRVEVTELPLPSHLHPRRLPCSHVASVPAIACPGTERFARNAHSSMASQLLITLFGVPEVFAAFLGLQTA